MRCYIIRHGRTQGNEERRYSGGRTDDPLCEAGRAELRPAEGVTGDYILLTSPMKRAMETAEIMFPDDLGTVIEEFRELDFGRLDGHSHAELDGDPDYQRWIDSGGTAQVPGGESMDTFQVRTMKGMETALRMAEEAGKDTIVIVAHGGTIMAAMSAMTGEPYYDFLANNGEGYCTEIIRNSETISSNGSRYGLLATSYNKYDGGVRPGLDRRGSILDAASYQMDRPADSDS